MVLLTLRRKYQLRVLMNPTLWLRNGATDKKWDKFLWQSLDDGKIEIVGNSEALINKVVVWIDNMPYGSGTFKAKKGHTLYCSRATALYLSDQLVEARILQKLAGPHDKYAILRDHKILMT